jgi:hypothetical protein
MKKITLMITCCFLLYSKVVFGQNSKKDTLFYFMDTNGKNSIWEISAFDKAKRFTINCHCLSTGENPWFAYAIDSGKIITEKHFKGLKTVNLKYLINLAKNNNATTVARLPPIIFIEKEDKYIIHRVAMYEPEGLY